MRQPRVVMQTEFILDSGGTQEIEKAIWDAVRNQPRDLSADEKHWIERNPGLRDSLLEWYESIASITAQTWTPANCKFAKRLYRLRKIERDEEQ